MPLCGADPLTTLPFPLSPSQHVSLSDEQAAIAFKLFIATFLNTGLIQFLLASKLTKDATKKYVPGAGDIDETKGVEVEFSDSWYKNIGVVLIFTLFMNAVKGKVIVIVQVREGKEKRKREKREEGWETQCETKGDTRAIERACSGRSRCATQRSQKAVLVRGKSAAPRVVLPPCPFGRRLLKI